MEKEVGSSFKASHPEGRSKNLQKNKKMSSGDATLMEELALKKQKPKTTALGSVRHKAKHLNSRQALLKTKATRKQHHNEVQCDDSPYCCTICKKDFTSKSGLLSHQKTHARTGTSKYEFCEKEFIHGDSYNEHLLTHTGHRHKCPHCDKEFVQRSNLVRHIRIHTGEKPYKCSFCEKAFSDKGACNSHIKIHTREEACGCSYCGRVFSNKQKLKNHIRMHTGEDLVGCDMCGKKFTNRYTLKEHQMIHKSGSQISCPYCEKHFLSNKYLQRHITAVHEPSRPYCCQLCPKSFSQRNRLRAHLMTHTGIKHVQCLLCAKTYSSQKSFRHHLFNMHGIPTEHPNYKKCFYSMTPEEVGLCEEIVMSPPSSPPPLLQADYELHSTEIDSSMEGAENDAPPILERQEPSNFIPIQFPPLLSVRTKAARKQMTFNLATSVAAVRRNKIRMSSIN